MHDVLVYVCTCVYVRVCICCVQQLCTERSFPPHSAILLTQLLVDFVYVCYVCYVCMYACTYVIMHIAIKLSQALGIHALLYAYVCISASICIYVQACSTCTACICVCTYAYIHVLMHTHTRMFIPRHAYTDTHARTHIIPAKT